MEVSPELCWSGTHKGNGREASHTQSWRRTRMAVLKAKNITWREWKKTAKKERGGKHYWTKRERARESESESERERKRERERERVRLLCVFATISAYLLR